MVDGPYNLGIVLLRIDSIPEIALAVIIIDHKLVRTVVNY